MLKLEEVKNIFGNKLLRLKKPFKSGKQLLIKEGCKECINPFYVQKDSTYAHFDNITRYWYFEEITDPDVLYSMEFDWLTKYCEPIAIYNLDRELKTVTINT